MQDVSATLPNSFDGVHNSIKDVNHGLSNTIALMDTTQLRMRDLAQTHLEQRNAAHEAEMKHKREEEAFEAVKHQRALKRKQEIHDADFMQAQRMQELENKAWDTFQARKMSSPSSATGTLYLQALSFVTTDARANDATFLISSRFLDLHASTFVTTHRQTMPHS